MKMLKMSGYPITNIYDYNRYFNIYDVLKYHKEFKSFVSSHFSGLSKTFSYCAAMAYTAVENQTPVFMSSNIYEKTKEIDFDACDSENFWNNPFSFCQTCSPSSELLDRSKKIAEQFAPKTGDIVFRKMMILSIAAFAFLNHDETEQRIDLDRAKRSFLGKEDNGKKSAFELYFEDDMSDCIQTVNLEPSAQTYRCLPFEAEDFTRIKTFRIAASRKINSLSNRTVKISVGDQQIIIPAGEHLYVNTINGRIANILPKSQSKKGRILRNAGTEKDVLKFDGENAPELDFYGSEYLSSFDFSADDCSIIYINHLRLRMDLCSSPALLKQLSEYSEEKLVEIKLVNSRFYLLKNNGELLSNDPRCSGEKQVYSIESVLGRYH